MFKERVVTIPSGELEGLRTMALCRHEVGGHIEPGEVNGECGLKRSAKVIVGTGVEEVSGADAVNYSGNADQESVKLLSTPFTGKNMTVSLEMCGRRGDYCNILWHSHPLIVSKMSPPSLGDIAAHCVLGNLRNWGKQKQINTQVVVAFEGLYEYGITPERFCEIVCDVDVLMAGKPWGDRDLPADVAAELRRRVFNELRDGYHTFFEQLDALTKRHTARFNTTSAPTHTLNKWMCTDKCGVKTLTFPYKRALDEPAFRKMLVTFHKENAYTKALESRGFYCRFFPYAGAIKLPVKVKSVVL